MVCGPVANRTARESVWGSIPLFSAIGVLLSGRALGLGPRGRWFDPSHSDHGPLALRLVHPADNWANTVRLRDGLPGGNICSVEEGWPSPLREAAYDEQEAPPTRCSLEARRVFREHENASSILATSTSMMPERTRMSGLIVGQVKRVQLPSGIPMSSQLDRTSARFLNEKVWVRLPPRTLRGASSKVEYPSHKRVYAGSSPVRPTNDSIT